MNKKYKIVLLALVVIAVIVTFVTNYLDNAAKQSKMDERIVVLETTNAENCDIEWEYYEVGDTVLKATIKIADESLVNIVSYHPIEVDDSTAGIYYVTIDVSDSMSEGALLEISNENTHYSEGIMLN